MANFLDKVKVAVAAQGKHKETFLSSHVSTTDFFQFNVAYAKELDPQESIKCGMETFARMESLARPTYGTATINNRGFFVPYRTVYPGWIDFIDDVPHTYYSSSSNAPGNTYHSQCPTFTMGSVFDCFFSSQQNADTLFAEHESSAGPWDYTIDRSGNTEYYKLTNLGRQALKLLNSLGYQLVTSESVADSLTVSAMPLLCVAKVYIDWYYPSAYAENVTFALIDQLTKRDGQYDVTFSSFDIGNILHYCSFVNYDSDYFVSAWDNPTAPNPGLHSDFTIPELSSFTSYNVNSSTSLLSSGSRVSNDTASVPGTSFSAGNPRSFTNDGTPAIENYLNITSSGTTSTVAPITQYLLDGLKSLTDYMKRHQLVGSRALDRYLVRYGINLTSEKLNRSVYLGSGQTNLLIGDVMSTADTSTASLGDYAGKGIINSKDKPFFADYEAKEQGMFIIVSSLIPHVSYYQGFDRTVLQTTRTQFWVPEFDNLGTQPVKAIELYVPEDGTSSLWTGLEQQIFGFQPRYAHQKVSHDRLTGDFRVRHLSNSGAEDAWHLFRDMDNFAANWNSASDIIHGMSFVTGSNDHEQYNRIFMNGVTSQDMFRIIYNFHIDIWTPKKPLYDTYRFDTDGRREVTTDANGVKMN